MLVVGASNLPQKAQCCFVGTDDETAAVRESDSMLSLLFWDPWCKVSLGGYFARTETDEKFGRYFIIWNVFGAAVFLNSCPVNYAFSKNILQKNLTCTPTSLFFLPGQIFYLLAGKRNEVTKRHWLLTRFAVQTWSEKWFVTEPVQDDECGRGLNTACGGGLAASGFFFLFFNQVD